MAALTPLRHRIGQERGAELIEMALVLPLLLLIVGGIIDFGLLFREFNVVTNAAREGARAGVLPEYGADGNVTARIQQYMDAAGMGITCPSADCVVTSPVIVLDGPAGQFDARDVRVTVFHQYGILGALTGGAFSSIALTGHAVMRMESGS